jgi:hypothetical protein
LKKLPNPNLKELKTLRFSGMKSPGAAITGNPPEENREGPGGCNSVVKLKIG